ncbi:MFS transporter [Streptomyces sp. Inha503]|uniref:MFS transporter n=1 Tax=Streptomyces sp. Inha503 TaxID=3383314 RepID=UPI0039A0821A
MTGNETPVSIGPDPETLPRLSRADVKVIGTAVLGWTVDMFDLMLILHVASHVSTAFFPSANPMLGLTATYGAFAVSLVVRPLGGLVFGSLADRAGRRRAMAIAVLGAGVTTALMGLLPGVATLGVAAPVSLMLLRVVQGVFVGGVSASAHTLATESVPERFRGLTAGLIKGGGASLAVVAINLLILAVTAVAGPDGFAAWGWRVLFLAGLLGSVLNYLALRRTEESPLWLRRRAQLAASAPAGAGPDQVERPGRALFSRRWRTLTLTSAAIVFTASAPYYLTTGILPTVYKQVFGLSQGETSSFVIINVVGSAAVAALCGHFSQRVGRKKVFLGAGVACLVLIPGLYAVMVWVDRPAPAFLLACSAVMVMASGAISAPLIIFLNELFPTELRSSATAFAWNVGYGLSGMMPTVVTAVSVGADDMVPTLIVMSVLLGALFLGLLARSGETRGALDSPTP